MKYALFGTLESCLLCEKEGRNSWYVINGSWRLEPPYKYTKGKLPPLLWKGSKLPKPRGDYNENIEVLRARLCKK